MCIRDRDRPEDVESPVDGTFIGKGAVYVVCTGNQTSEGINGNAANPRRKNEAGATEKNFTGQIIRINEENGDHAKTKFTWEVFVMGGDHSAEFAPNTRNDGETYNLSSWKDGRPTTLGDRFAMPDNITFDKKGFAFFTTDGTPDNFPCNDGIYVVSTNAPAPRTVKRFLTGPIAVSYTHLDVYKSQHLHLGILLHRLFHALVEACAGLGQRFFRFRLLPYCPLLQRLCRARHRIKPKRNGAAN